MPTLKAVIYQILDTAKASSDPANYSRVRTMFFEEYAIIAKRNIDTYGFNSQYLQTFEVDTTYVAIPNSFKIHSTGSMRRTTNPLPRSIMNRITDYVSITDNTGKLYTTMSDSGYSNKVGDKYLANINVILARNNYLWIPNTTSDVNVTLSITNPYSNPIEALDAETTIGLTIEDDMELPIPSNIISIVKLEVLSKNFGLHSPRQTQANDQTVQ